MTGPPPPDPGRLIPAPNPSMPHPVTIECIHRGQAFLCDASSQAAGDRTCGPCAIAPGRPSQRWSPDQLLTETIRFSEDAWHAAGTLQMAKIPAAAGRC